MTGSTTSLTTCGEGWKATSFTGTRFAGLAFQTWARTLNSALSLQSKFGNLRIILEKLEVWNQISGLWNWNCSKSETRAQVRDERMTAWRRSMTVAPRGTLLRSDKASPGRDGWPGGRGGWYGPKNALISAIFQNISIKVMANSANSCNYGSYFSSFLKHRIVPI